MRRHSGTWLFNAGMLPAGAWQSVGSRTLRRSGKDPMFPDETPERITSMRIRADQFYGRPLATCAQEYLDQRKKATGEQACDVAEILKALEQGGFDFRAVGWRDNDRLRSLSISLAKNTKV